MANPTGKGGNRFKKGESGNPSGRPKKDPLIQKVKELSYKEFIMSLHKFGHLTREQVAQEIMNPNATMFEVMFGQIVASAAKGDRDSRQVLLERLWGKVKDVLQMEPPEPVVIKRLDGSEVSLDVREKDATNV